jgi:histidinol-phosphate aminotransferase
MTQPVDLIRRHIRAIKPYQPIFPLDVLAMRLSRPVEELVKLDANENPYGPPEPVREALAGLPFPHIYPDPESRVLRAALASYSSVPEENLLAGAGADELIDLIMRLFLEPEDAILHCPPTFGMYAFDAAVNNARTISVARSPSFELDLDAISRAVAAERPKLVFLASPNNPDGGLVTHTQLDRLLELPVVVVLDEAYMEFAPARSSKLAEVPLRDNLIVLRTFSKWAGLAGLRVGYGAFPLPLMPHLWKIKQPYNVSIAASTAALAALVSLTELEEQTRRIVLERARLFSALQSIPGLVPVPSQANFVLCRVDGINGAVLQNDLAQVGILVRYFNIPGLHNYIRISVGKPEDTDRLTQALKRIMTLRQLPDPRPGDG